MRTKVALDMAAGTRYSTSDGGAIELGDGEVIAAIELRFEHREAPAQQASPQMIELPTDVVACDLWLPDAEGRVWKTTTRSTTEVFVRHMIDISSHEGYLFTLDHVPEEFARAFENEGTLEDARFSSDDRFYRAIILRMQIVQFQFFYTTFRFDVGVVRDEDPLMVKLAVRVREDCLVQLLNDEGDISTVPPFGFFMEWRYLFTSNTAAFFADYKRWHDVPIPMPLVFTLTDEVDAPQPKVRVA